MINEEFLSYIWRFRLCNNILQSTDGEDVEILHPGFLNTDSGPDFTNARIRIGGTLWAGNVEIHVNTSDWNAHGHQHDTAYANVILHVVYNSDIQDVIGGTPAIPTVELAGTFDMDLLDRFESFRSERGWIPCGDACGKVDPFIINSWLNTLVFERYAIKTEAIISELKLSNGDLEHTFYLWLACAFGASLNTQPFGLLARSLPLHIISRHADDLLQVEALLFGQAGMLHTEFADDYPILLQKEYFYLRKKWQLEPIPGHLWKFHRLRPAGFPTLRIAQFASVISKNRSLISAVSESADINDLSELFNARVSSYWKTHYSFDAAGGRYERCISQPFKNIIILNAVVPVLFALSRIRDDIQFTDRALLLLDSLAAENNSVVKKFGQYGIIAASAMQSQALIQLRTAYCGQFRCLDCRIGHAILTMKVP